MAELSMSIRLLLLLAAANMAPIGLERVLGTRWGCPIDAGRRFVDGKPWLGPSKTWRGLGAAVAACGLLAPLLGLGVDLGLQVPALSMAGDVLSSFVKRRLAVGPGGRATGLDQIPEALLPVLGVRSALGLSWPAAIGVVLAFFVLEMPLARWAHRHGLRRQPH